MKFLYGACVWTVFGAMCVWCFPALSEAQTAIAAATPKSINVPPNTHLHEDSFQTLFSTATQQLHICVIGESFPYRPFLSSEKAKMVGEVLADSSIKVEEKVTALANAFDYDPQNLGNGVFTLTKRYSNADDLPEVTFEESLASCRNIMKAMDALNPHTEQDIFLVRDILNVASDDERKQLAEGVLISTLPASLQVMALRLASVSSIGAPLDIVQRAALRFSGLKKPSAHLQNSTNLGLTYPAYSGEFSPKGDMRVVVLGYYMRTSLGGGTAFIQPNGITIKDGLVVGNFTDPTTPDLVPPPVQPRSAVQKTLAEIVSILNSRSFNDKVNLKTIETDSTVARKTVSLFGENNVGKSQLLQAVIQIYGLRLVQNSETTLKITVPSAQPAQRASEIAIIVRHLLPASFLRAMMKRALYSKQEREVRQLQIRRERLDRSKPSLAEESLFIVSLKRLRTLIEPLLKVTNKKRIPMKEVSDEIRDLIALTSLISAQFHFKTLLGPQWPTLDKIGDAKLRVNVNGQDVTYSISVTAHEGEENEDVTGHVTLPSGP